MKQIKDECPACEEIAAVEQSYDKDLTYKGADLHVEGLLQMCCAECGYSFETHDQHDLNVASIKQVFLEQREEYKRRHGLLTGAQIRKIRKELGLHQQPAAQLFGGGLNAFSKYENEEIVQTTAMDRLIRVISALGRPGVQLLSKVVKGEADNTLVLTSGHHYVSGSSTARAQLLMAKQARVYGFGIPAATGSLDEQEKTVSFSEAASNINNVTVEFVQGAKKYQRNPVTGAYFAAAGD